MQGSIGIGWRAARAAQPVQAPELSWLKTGCACSLHVRLWGAAPARLAGLSEFRYHPWHQKALTTRDLTAACV